jgi:hypothetical protein
VGVTGISRQGGVLMGTIAHFDLFDLYTSFGIRHFVETGTGSGEAIRHLIDNPIDDWHSEPVFRTLLSCEIDFAMADKVRDRFRHKDPRVRIFNEKSGEFLDWVCNILPYDEPILFWLDAHFPGADQGFGGNAGFGDEQNVQVRLPLRRELDTIKLRRPAAKDVIVCDDLRIYTDGPFQSGNVPPDVRSFCPKERDIGFVHEIMGGTHNIEELYEHEGYILITPKAT